MTQGPIVAKARRKVKRVIIASDMGRRIKNLAIYGIVRAAVATLGRVPLGCVLSTGRILGSLAYALACGERRRAVAQLRAAYGDRLSAGRAELLTRGMFVRLAVHAVEACRLARDPGALAQVELPQPSRQALDRALAPGRGAVFATGHLGNFELMAAGLAAQGYPIHTIARQSYEPRITRLLDDRRRACGVTCIYRDQPGAAAAMLRVLRRGEVLGLLMDQDTRVPSVFVPFFGKQASTPKGAAALALSTRSALVVGSIHRAPSGRHIIDIAPCDVPNDETAATAALTLAIEQRIRRHPADWLWFHERWKTKDPSEVTS